MKNTSTKIKVRYALIIIVALILLIGSYVGVGNLFGVTQSNASKKTGVEIEGEKYVYENDDDLIVTGEDVDVSGKTYKQIKEEMEKEAEENGGIIGD